MHCTAVFTQIVFSFNLSAINLERLTCMVRKMSLNDDQFRQIMVMDNSDEYGDREDQVVIKQHPARLH